MPITPNKISFFQKIKASDENIIYSHPGSFVFYLNSEEWPNKMKSFLGTNLKQTHVNSFHIASNCVEDKFKN